MKAITFTFVLLILLGVTWTLYLTYKDKQFVDNLPKASKIGVPAEQTASENEKTGLAEASTLKSSSHKNAPVETRHTFAPAHTPMEIDPELTRNRSEEQAFEERGTSNQSPTHLVHPEAGPTLESLLQEERTAQETLERIMMNPENWFRGKPGDVGFILGLTESDWEESAAANYILNPSPENRPIPFGSGSQEIPTLPTSETLEPVQLKGGKYTVYLPIR